MGSVLLPIVEEGPWMAAGCGRGGGAPPAAGGEGQPVHGVGGEGVWQPSPMMELVVKKTTTNLSGVRVRAWGG